VWLWVTVGLTTGAFAGTVAMAPSASWQFVHFQKQNLGMAALAASSNGVTGLRPYEHRALLLAGWVGVAGLMAHPGLLHLSVDSGLGAVFPATAVLFAGAVAMGVVALVRRPRADRPGGFCVVYLASLLFSLPVFVLDSPYAVAGGMTVAHGLQYLLLIGLMAAGGGQGTRRLRLLAVLCDIALVGGVALSAASRLLYAAPGGRLLFGAYLGVLMAHFLIDAGVWRLRTEISERPRSWRRTADVMQNGMLARLACAGLAEHGIDSPDRARVRLVALGCAWAAFLACGLAMWGQLIIGWQWSRPDTAVTTTAIVVMSGAMLLFLALAVLAAAPIAWVVLVRIARLQVDELLSPMVLFAYGMVTLIIGSCHFGRSWPGTGGRPWAYHDLVPSQVASFNWASTRGITAYWAHPSALRAFSLDEIAWMAVSPVAMVCLVVGAATMVRRLQLHLRFCSGRRRLPDDQSRTTAPARAGGEARSPCHLGRESLRVAATGTSPAVKVVAARWLGSRARTVAAPARASSRRPRSAAAWALRNAAVVWRLAWKSSVNSSKVGSDVAK
jgi:hypothetical protein